MSLVDTKERIFVNGQIYSRPVGFGGPVGGPDTRPAFRPDSDPYNVGPDPVEPEIRDFLFRPGVDEYEIRKPIFRPGVDSIEVVPLDFLNKTLEQNKEVMGSKRQVFPRYANPDDGTLIAEPTGMRMASLDPQSEMLLRALRKGEIGPLSDPNIRKAITDLEKLKYNKGRV